MGESHSIHSSETSRSGKTVFVRDRQRLGKYQILAELGRGGAAAVSLAVARGKGGVHKLVVLKALLPELAEEPDAVTAFLDEARLAAQLNHPNVVQTYEVGTESGRHVIVMEYLDGQSLSRISRTVRNAEATFPAAIHLRIISEVLEGLHYAHEMKAYDGHLLQLVHRDVSPQNVFITYDGQVKILDFGIAKAATSSTHTAAGIMKGKIAYMAPEQMAGTVVDRRADIYSVGCMLWAAATGQKLWHDMPDVQVVRAVIAGRIPKPRSVNPDCSEELESIVMRAIQLDPDKRFATALEFQSELEQYTEKLGRAVKQRDIGRFVSQLFADSRTEFNESIEQEVAAMLLADDLNTDRESSAELTDNRSIFPPAQPVEPTGASGVLTTNHAKSNKGMWIGIGLLGLTAIVALAYPYRGKISAAKLSTEPASGTVHSTWSNPTRTVEPAPTPERATIRLEVTPANAQLSLDGHPIAVGTDEVTLPIGDATHELIAEADGYARSAHAFKVASSTTITLELTRAPEAKKTSGTRMRVAPPSAVIPAAPPVVTKPAAAACDNPFFVDAQGIKRVRPNCL